MRFGLLSLVGAVLALTRRTRQNYPWCAQYSGRALGGATNCDFVSFAQCLATVSGIGGFCVRNTMYQPPVYRHRKKIKSLIYWRWRRAVSACPERSNLAVPY